jgi:hypothetical protein
MLLNYALRVTQYNHPDITSGMHTNGPANVFVRPGNLLEVAYGDWYLVDRHEVRNLVKVHSLIAELGIERFIAYYCTLAEK